MRRALLAALGAVLAVAAGCARELPVNLPLIPQGRAGEEERIAAVLDDVHRGMEQRKIYKVLAHVSPNYLDAEGRRYEDMREYLGRVMKQYRQVRITRTRPKVLVEGNRARAVETFGTVAGPVNPEETTSVNLQGQVPVFLERVNDEWKIVEWGSIR